MDPSERVSSRLMCKRAALSTLNNNAAGLESDSSSKPIKRAKNTSRVRSRAYVARAEQDELGTGKTGASGKQQGSQKPSELPADEQGSANSGLEQPGSRTDKEQRSAENGHDKQGATEQPPPGGIGEGVNPGVRAGGIGGSKDRSNAGAPLEKGDAEKVRAGDGVNGRAQDANIQGGAGLSAEAAAQAAKSVAGDGVADRGVPAKAADAATATGAKDGAPQQSADAGAADDANEGGEMHGQATDVGESSQVNCRSTQQEAANEGVPRHSVNPSGTERCTYTRCTYVRGKEGQSPDEVWREGASKACRTCGACLHNLCCQEITGREGDFICENCHKGAQHGGGTAPPSGKGKKYAKRVSRWLL